MRGTNTGDDIVSTDIEIARAATLRPIADIAEKLGLTPEAIEPYGHHIAKLAPATLKALGNRPKGKLILVTAINPTPAGEGKTTTTIGLGDALNRIGRSACIALREPSLGPVFGRKGGATGGGQSQVLPMEKINLHFTGDFHAITSAHNLLAALIDNALHFRLPTATGQRSMPATHHLAARPRHERPHAAQPRRRPRRRQRPGARDRLRHHRGVRSHGHPLPRQ